MKLRVSLDKGAKMPTRAYQTDAGFDLYSVDEQIIMPYSRRVFDTGVHLEIPEGYVGFVKSKSGLMCNFGITSDGTIDAGYTGSIRVCLINNSAEQILIDKHQKISQIVIVPIAEIEKLVYVDELPESERGENGFGSSGKF